MQLDRTMNDYSATAAYLIVPLGPGLWRAHRSSSVIGTVMQKVPGTQGPHGEVAVSVIGGHELAAVADEVSLLTLVSSIVAMAHGAGAAVGAGAGAGAISKSSATNA